MAAKGDVSETELSPVGVTNAAEDHVGDNHINPDFGANLRGCLFACKHVDGIILAADSLLTTSSGQKIHDTKKIISVYDHIYIMASGSISTLCMMADYLRKELQIKKEYVSTMVECAARMASLLIRKRDQLATSVDIIVAGWTRYEGCVIYDVPFRGEVKWVGAISKGSGDECLGLYEGRCSLYMSEHTAKCITIEGMKQAVGVDKYSGGAICMLQINSKGTEGRFKLFPDNPENPRRYYARSVCDF